MKTLKKLFIPKNAALPAVFCLFLFVQQGIHAERFAFQHRAGDKFKISSTVQEEIYQNRSLVYRSEFINKISTQVTDVIDGVAIHSLIYQTAEKAKEPDGSDRFIWEDEQRSVFGRDSQGRISLADNYFLPSVRDVPLFPERDIKQGDTWRSLGSEVHNFKLSLGIDVPEPYKIPFVANYTYLGEKTWHNRTYKAFSINYRISVQPPSRRGVEMPSKITGESKQMVYWDSDLGQAMGAEETFRLTFEWPDGHSIEFRATGEAETENTLVLNKEKVAKELSVNLEKLNITGSSVEITEEGVKLSLENILFPGDSSVLKPTEQGKLDLILQLLAPFKERDLLVEGHTALAGSKEFRDKLSLERAKSVASYFIQKGARTADHIVIRGHGAEKPIAPNSSENGMRKNRRVEITILEN
jgi:outer membrane protein OmpA-like peptidoglycan-associated protein